MANYPSQEASMPCRKTYTPDRNHQANGSDCSQNIRAALQETSSDEPTIIIVTDQIHSLSSLLEKISGIRPIATTNGVYQLSLAEKSILIVNAASLPQPLPVGVYIPISARTAPQNSKVIHVADKEYHFLNSQGAWFLFHVL